MCTFAVNEQLLFLCCILTKVNMCFHHLLCPKCHALYDEWNQIGISDRSQCLTHTSLFCPPLKDPACFMCVHAPGLTVHSLRCVSMDPFPQGYCCLLLVCVRLCLSLSGVLWVCAARCRHPETLSYCHRKLGMWCIWGRHTTQR